MLSIKDKGRLLQIISHCKRIEEIIKQTSKQEYNENLGIREMICFNIFQIGELAKGLTDEFIQQYNEQPWKQIKGMRDIIGHGYETIDLEIVWDTANTSIRDLCKYLDLIILNNN